MNAVEEETNGPRIVISLTVMTGISLLMMMLRFFCKARYGKRFGWDDHLLGASWVGPSLLPSFGVRQAGTTRRNWQMLTSLHPPQMLLVIYSGLIAVAVTYGIGRRRAVIPYASLVQGLRLLYVGRFFGIIALAISKTSFAITLLQLARGMWQRAAIWFIIVSLNLVMWICGFSLFFQCAPVYKAWDLNAPGTCMDSRIQVNISLAASGKLAA